MAVQSITLHDDPHIKLKIVHHDSQDLVSFQVIRYVGEGDDLHGETLNRDGAWSRFNDYDIILERDRTVAVVVGR